MNFPQNIFVKTTITLTDNTIKHNRKMHEYFNTDSGHYFYLKTNKKKIEC